MALIQIGNPTVTIYAWGVLNTFRTRLFRVDWVALATANGKRCEWAGYERRRKAEHGGVGTPHSRDASEMVIGSSADEVGTFYWRSRARRLVGSVTRRRGGSSAHPTHQWERPRNRSHVAVRDRTTKPSWEPDAQAGLMRIPAFLPQRFFLK